MSSKGSMMRFNGIGLAGVAGLAMIASQAPALAGDSDFFLEQHRTYFESGNRPAYPLQRPDTARQPAATVQTVSAPAEQDQQPVFGRGHAVYSGEPADRPLASAIPRELVAFDGAYPPGTIYVSTEEKRLYYVLPDGQAIRYGVGVGRPGFEWSGGQTITAKREWPDWTPPAAMIKRRPDLPRHMAGGIDNPLGARAMYLGSSEYRIHGSNEPDTIGQAVSSGCIRMTNEDVADLYERAKVGTKVIVR